MYTNNINITKAGLILLFISSITLADDLIVGPIGDADCDYNTIQDAVNSGGSDMLIFVSNQLTTNGGVIIHNKPVRGLYGGYEDCADARSGTLHPGYTSTTISNPAGTALTLFETRAGFSAEIDVNGFNLIDSNIGLSIGNGASTVEFIVDLTNVDIYNNNQGIFVSQGTKDVTVVNYNYGEIYNNTVAGGIYCVSSTVNLGDVVSIHDNTSTRGGGIYGRFCDITLESGDNKPIDETTFGIFKNTATENGGGVYIDSSNFTATGNKVFLASISFNTAPTITSFAIGLGGGFFIGSASVVNLNHTRVYGNIAAREGGGIYMAHTNASGIPPVLTMKRSNSHCTVRNSRECSILSYNRVTENSGKGGGAVYLGDDTQANIFQTEINNNKANQSSAFHISENSILNLEGNLIINNQLEDPSAHLIFSSVMFANANSTTTINFTTFADNTPANLFRLSAMNTFFVNNSILAHDEEIFKTFGEVNYDNVDVGCSLYTDIPDTFHSNFFNANTLFDNNPEFNSAIDYGLMETSPTLDSACSNLYPANYTDIVGFDRTSEGPADLGAYERPTDTLIFNNGFE